MYTNTCTHIYSKGISALLSGESKDTAEMGVLGTILDHHLPPLDRRTLFRSWGSSFVMIPKGGNTVWGGPDFPAPDFDNDVLAKEGALVCVCVCVRV